MPRAFAMNGYSAATSDRPILEVSQGRYFRWAMPRGWQVNETISGVDLGSPDGLTRATANILLRAFGFVKPAPFLMRILPSVPGLTDLRCISATALPEQPAGALRSPWRVEELELAFRYYGYASRGTCVCGVSSSFASYDAFVLGYHSLAERFDLERFWLARIARSVAITDPRSVAGNDQLIPPKNRPLDNSALIESWQRNRLSNDHIAKAWQEGMMGYERVKDAETGRIYEAPLEAYDGTIGGYRNPVRPTEILQKTQPGE
jgi:hypothetical protein